MIQRSARSKPHARGQGTACTRMDLCRRPESGSWQRAPRKVRMGRACKPARSTRTCPRVRGWAGDPPMLVCRCLRAPRQARMGRAWRRARRSAIRARVPRVRGWTKLLDAAGGLHVVTSARARMDRQARHRRVFLQVTSHAYAWMNLRESSPLLALASSVSARTDGPKTIHAPVRFPHACGWTALHGAQHGTDGPHARVGRG